MLSPRFAIRFLHVRLYNAANPADNETVVGAANAIAGGAQTVKEGADGGQTGALKKDVDRGFASKHGTGPWPACATRHRDRRTPGLQRFLRRPGL